MKTFTVIPSDNIVTIDNVAKPVDCSAVDPTIHAIQWNEEKQKGHIEFIDEDPYDGVMVPNVAITSIEEYQYLIDAWDAYELPSTEPPAFATLTK